VTDTQTITPDDLEAKFGQLKDEIDGTTNAAQTSILRTGGIVVLVVLILAFLIGKRRGRANRTVVEIRRV
jgi:hypothetical protein